MKSMIKKTFKMLCLCLLISSLTFTPVFAAENTTISTETETESSRKVVFMNVGFPFDRCDVDGTITLYDMSGRVVGNTPVVEHKLVYGVARVRKIYPVGGKYATGSYSLRVSDGNIGTFYTGTF